MPVLILRHIYKRPEPCVVNPSPAFEGRHTSTYVSGCDVAGSLYLSHLNSGGGFTVVVVVEGVVVSGVVIFVSGFCVDGLVGMTEVDLIVVCAWGAVALAFSYIVL